MVTKIGIHTPDLFKRVNQERIKSKQRPLEDKAMALVFSIAFTALTKKWVDFKDEFIHLEEEQSEAIEKICREKFNIDLSGIVQELGLTAMQSALFEQLKRNNVG